MPAEEVWRALESPILPRKPRATDALPTRVTARAQTFLASKWIEKFDTGVFDVGGVSGYERQS